MLRYIIVFLIGFSATYGFNHKFTNPVDMPNTYVANQNEYYIQVDMDSLVVYKDDIAIYHKYFQNCTKIIKNSLDSFRVKQYYDYDKIDTILFYRKLDLFDKDNNIIAEISISKEKLSIISNKKVKEIEFSLPKRENLLDNDINLNIEWSSFYGGSNNDVLVRIFSNSMGDLVIGGYSDSPSINGKLPIRSRNNIVDVMLMTLSPDGDIKWLTYIGSGFNDYFYSLAIDKDDNIWVSCETRGDGFYTKPNSYKYAGGTADAALCHFSKDGDVLYSTVMGGQDYEALTDIQIGKDGKIWACGRTLGEGFPITSNAEMKTNKNNGGLLVGIEPDYKLFYSTFYNAPLPNEQYFNSDYLRIDNEGNIVVVGTTYSKVLVFGTNDKYGLTNSGGCDVYIAKFNKDGRLIWSRFVGGSANDVISGIVIDSLDNIILNVITLSDDMECKGKSTALKDKKNLYEDNYLAKFSPDGELIWGGYFGGSREDSQIYDGLPIVRSDIKIAPQGEIIFTFFTMSNDLMVNDQSIYKSNQGDRNAFILVLDENTDYLYSTYFGGISSDYPSCMLLRDGKLYLLGYTSSIVFPIVNRSSVHSKGGNDGFLVCFNTNLVKRLPPEISDFEVSDCNSSVEYVILDKNIEPGFMPEVVYKSENCNITSSYEFDTDLNIAKLTVHIDRLESSKNAYYKLEIENKLNKNIVIEDSLLASAENYLRLEPNNIADFGKQSIYSEQYCDKILIYNDGQSDYTIKDVYLNDNTNFSYPPSQLPFVVPANSSREFIICSSSSSLLAREIRDTIWIKNPCVNLNLPLKIVYFAPEINSDSKCFVPISIEDNDNMFSSKSIISNSNSVNLKLHKAEDFDITLYNSISSKIEEPKIIKSQNNIDIDFDNLANGVYFIHLNSGENQKTIKLLLMR